MLPKIAGENQQQYVRIYAYLPLRPAATVTEAGRETLKAMEDLVQICHRMSHPAHFHSAARSRGEAA
jgi:hypothetical protein